MHYHARVRAALPLIAVLGLVAGAINALATDDGRYFVSLDAPSALLLETRKHSLKQYGPAPESLLVEAPKPAASPFQFLIEPAWFLPRSPADRPRPGATGPPGPRLLAAR